jgi:hypothetical protein
LNILANLELERRDPLHVVPAGPVPDDAWDAIFAELFALRDTSDFAVMYLLNLLYAFWDTPSQARRCGRRPRPPSSTSTTRPRIRHPIAA